MGLLITTAIIGFFLFRFTNKAEKFRDKVTGRANSISGDYRIPPGYTFVFQRPGELDQHVKIGPDALANWFGKGYSGEWLVRSRSEGKNDRFVVEIIVKMIEGTPVTEERREEFTFDKSNFGTFQESTICPETLRFTVTNKQLPSPKMQAWQKQMELMGPDQKTLDSILSSQPVTKKYVALVSADGMYESEKIYLSPFDEKTHGALPPEVRFTLIWEVAASPEGGATVAYWVNVKNLASDLPPNKETLPRQEIVIPAKGLGQWQEIPAFDNKPFHIMVLPGKAYNQMLIDKGYPTETPAFAEAAAAAKAELLKPEIRKLLASEQASRVMLLYRQERQGVYSYILLEGEWVKIGGMAFLSRNWRVKQSPRLQPETRAGSSFTLYSNRGQVPEGIADIYYTVGGQQKGNFLGNALKLEKARANSAARAAAAAAPATPTP